MKPWLPAMFAASWVMVIVQCCTALAIAVGVVLPSCKSSDQCSQGLYCQVGFTDRCAYCGSNAPLFMQVDPGDPSRTYNAVFDSRFSGFNQTLVRQVCANPEDTPVMCAKLCPTQTGAHDVEGYEIGVGYDMEVGDVVGRTCGQICEDPPAGELCDGGTICAPGYPIGFMSMGHWDKPYSFVQIREWCDHCVFAATFDADSTSQFGLMNSNVQAMGTRAYAQRRPPSVASSLSHAHTHALCLV